MFAINCFYDLDSLGLVLFNNKFRIFINLIVIINLFGVIVCRMIIIQSIMAN